MTNRQFLEQEIAAWKASSVRNDQVYGQHYYQSDHDILHRKRLVIGRGGKLTEVKNLPNNKIVDNQYGKAVDQKANYLVGRPFTVDTSNKQYAECLKQVFNHDFRRKLKTTCLNSLNGGVGWMYVFCDENEELQFIPFPAYEILPFWKDREHTELDMAVRLYTVEQYEGTICKKKERVEVYTTKGVERYYLEGNCLIPDVEHPGGCYLSREGKSYGWDRVPLIAFKYNNQEIPLIKRVKSLQDAINTILSDFQNNMQEDARSTVLVIKGYTGTDLGEFRQNLSQYSAIKIDSDSQGDKGDVSSLQIEVNAENYQLILDLLKKAMIENARCFDAKDDRLSGTPNQMNIQSMYSDIDLDANGMELEYQAAFEDLQWFIRHHLKNTGQGDFTKETADIIFNRDMMMNESDIIDNCQKSVGILSDETIISQHPWSKDVEQEMQRLQRQKQEDQNEYNQAFPVNQGGNDEP